MPRLPRELRDRAEAARALLGPHDIEWSPSAPTKLSPDTSMVLSVASLTGTDREVKALLHDWSQQLDIDGEIRLIEQSAAQRPTALSSAIRGLGRGSVVPDVVAAIRATGWTVTAIDRLDVSIDGSSQRWVDLRAANIVAKARRARD